MGKILSHHVNGICGSDWRWRDGIKKKSMSNTEESRRGKNSSTDAKLGYGITQSLRRHFPALFSVGKDN